MVQKSNSLLQLMSFLGFINSRLSSDCHTKHATNLLEAHLKCCVFELHSPPHGIIVVSFKGHIGNYEEKKKKDVVSWADALREKDFRKNIISNLQSMIFTCSNS